MQMIPYGIHAAHTGTYIHTHIQTHRRRWHKEEEAGSPVDGGERRSLVTGRRWDRQEEGGAREDVHAVID